ncbi:ribonuclease domain-containing protein [Dyella acidisoli]|uniref:Uncharacterized protein n=1 Tax=Dyella acidisoli TaxID=1867834 RepID=A0ABQ5XUW4_9GAMM|nr:ribonuclease domain-containing protein [Dyella acidisoli]GLQ95515.1 hypothetical protein GCM10007901_44700 [Dyella acidisoli]
MNHAVRCTILGIAIFGVAQVAFAAAIPECGRLPVRVRDASRDMSFCLTAIQPPAGVCGGDGVDVQPFGNNENRLPRAGRGQGYYEGKARQDDGSAGTDRLVFLVTDSASKTYINEKYYSSDHYETFCHSP